jgi:hypothetical protein
MLHDSSALQHQQFAMPASTSSNGAGTTSGGVKSENGKFPIIQHSVIQITDLYVVHVLLITNSPHSRLSGHWKLEDKQHFSTVENRQASTTYLRNLSTFICTIRTSQASRAFSYQRKTVRMPRMHKMFRPSRPAVTASTEATHDNNALLETSKPTRERKQHRRCRQR